MEKIIVCLIILYSTSALSNDKIGVDVLQCPKEKVKVQLLTTFELQLYDDKAPLALQVEGSASKKASKVIKNLAGVSPVRAKKYESALRSFYKRIKWSKKPLENIADSSPPIISKGCKLKQIAIPAPKNEYAIDKQLWEALDETNKAILMLETIVASDAYSGGNLDSNSTRALVRYLIRNNHLDTYELFPLVESINPSSFDVVYKNGVKAIFGKNEGNGSMCAFLLPTGEGIDLCSKGVKFRQYSDLKGNFSGYVDNSNKIDKNLLTISGEFFGVPAKINAISGGKWISLAAPLEIKSKNLAVRCLPGEKVLFRKANHFFKFDLPNSNLQSCTLDPSYLNTLKIGEDEVLLSDFSIGSDLDKGIEEILNSRTKISLAKPGLINFRGQKLRVSEINGHSSRIILDGTSTWKFEDQECSIHDEVVAIEKKYEDFTQLQFETPCPFFSKYGRGEVSSAIVKNSSNKFSGNAILANEANLTYGVHDLVLDQGKARFEDGEIISGLLETSYNLTVWEGGGCGSCTSKIRFNRYVPKGATITWDDRLTYMNENDYEEDYVKRGAFSVSGRIVSDLPYKIGLYNYSESTRNNRSRKVRRYIEVVGLSIIADGAVLYRGTLSKRQKIPMLYGYSDDPWEARLVYKWLDKGTKIKLGTRGPGYGGYIIDLEEI